MTPSGRSLLALCCVVVFASGCSVKFMYNNADRFARWSVSDYIDMDAAQRDYFDEEFGAIMYWHRSEELPRYASYLESLETVLGDDAEPEDVQGVMDSLFSWWDRFEARSINMVTEMLLSLSDEQVEKLPLRLADDNAELSEDEHDQPLEDIQESWWQGYSDTLSRFSGRLTKDQKGYLAAQSVRYVPQFDLWADYRRRWQGDLLALLHEKRGNPEVFAGEFLELLAQRESYYGEELAAVFDSNKKLARDVTAWLINDFDDKQRERFFTRIGELAVAFRELSEDLPDEVPRGGGCLVRC